MPGAVSILSSERQVLRFLIAGGLAAAINWLARFPLALVLPQALAIVLAYAIGMFSGFHLYRRFVFPGSKRSTGQQIVIFIAVNLFGALIVLALTLLLLRAQADLHYADFVKEGLAHGVAIACGAVVNFIGHKTLTFRFEPGASAATAPLTGK